MKNILGILFLVTLPSLSQEDALKLWYAQPAGTQWESAMPIGNGHIGAMVYGNVANETYQLNEHTVWSGGPNRNDSPEALGSLDKIRELIFTGEYKAAEQLANEKIISHTSHGQKFQPVGELLLSFPEHGAYSDYHRELDLGRAVTGTSYTVNGVKFKREAFVSIPDRVMVVHLTADRPGKITFTATFDSQHKIRQKGTDGGSQLSLWGRTSDHEGVEGLVEFRALAEIVIEGGKMDGTSDDIEVKKANSATILISIASNFNNYNDLGADENLRAEEYLKKVEGRSYNDLLESHTKGYKKYFDRVQLDLGSTEASKLPTDKRLENFRDAEDPSFVTLYYQYGRYLLISASQPGGQPANLQGIWNNSMDPAWDSKYTININTEMNYWPAEKTNLAEMHEPLLKMVRELSETGQKTAKDMYGAKGWMAHHNTDIWRTTGAVDGAFWGIWNGGGGWLSQHLWEHYLYSGDLSYLASVYPILKGAAAFYADFLIAHPNHPWLVTAPGNSPENAPEAHQGSSLSAGSTMDNQIVFDVFSTVIQASGLLGKDRAFADSLIGLRSKLPPMQIGKHGQLQEWLDDVDDPEDHHRHISHLYGLYPSNQISAHRTPELFAAARTTLLQRGDISTGWSMGWKVNWWAKMLDGNHAYSLIQNQLTPLGVNSEGGGTYTNLFDAHPPFQIDGNFGCTSGITEMLLQSSDGAVHLLPALPDALHTGKISGLRARGGFTITNMEWRAGNLVTVTIRSDLGGNLRLRTPNKMGSTTGKGLMEAAGENQNPFYWVPTTAKPIISEAVKIMRPTLPTTFLYDLPTTKGGSYTIVME
ncbi:MAG: glycoside hydrolase family 95 protein [Sediminicola sp.]